MLLFRQPCVQFGLQATPPLKDYPRNTRPGRQIYSTLCVVRQSPWLTGLQSSFIMWTLLRSSFTGCNPELVNLSSLKLLHCISCSFDGDLFLSRVQYRFSLLDSRLPFLARASFGNGTGTKTIAGKPFGRRRVKWWLSVRYLSDARYITAKLRNRMREKPLRYLKKKKKNLSDVI